MQSKKYTMNAAVIAPGDILLFYHPRGVELVISFLTKSSFYHVAIALNQHELIEAVASGVIRSALETKRGKRFLVISPRSKDAARAAVVWAKSKIGDGYDPADLVSIALDRIFAHLHVYFARKGRFTCGEFVATAYKQAGSNLIPNVNPQDVVPADFARLLPRKVRSTFFGANSLGLRTP